MYEISTKLEILDSEFQVRFSHNPIHHMERRLKSLNSILGKLQRRNLPLTVDAIKDNLFDVAGVRVICNYRDDVYSVANYLSAQSDIQVLRVKDYIKNPKQNGYRSLHVIYAVPVFLSSGPHYTPVEVQLRTIAMDYWASLEHALRYKTDLPDAKLAEHSQTLLDCARSLQNIETQMQNIHRDINSAPRVGERRRQTDVFGKWRLTDKSLPVNRHFRRYRTLFALTQQSWYFHRNLCEHGADEDQRAADVGSCGHDFAEQQRAAHRGEERFERHDHGRARRRHQLLSDHLQRVCHAGRADAGVHDGKPALHGAGPVDGAFA